MAAAAAGVRRSQPRLTWPPQLLTRRTSPAAAAAVQVNDKITLATDFLYHWGTKEATATVGYDATLRQCRLRGKIDTNGVVTAYLEERFSPGINFVLSAELDHGHSNYKFGFGVVAGE